MVWSSTKTNGGLLALGNNYKNFRVKIGDEKNLGKCKQELLETEIGRNLRFDGHTFS